MVGLEDLGRAKQRIVIDKRETPRSSEGERQEPRVPGRVSQSAAESRTTSDYDKEKLREPLARSPVAFTVINVGAATETALKEKKARVEDALHATRAAIEEGIVPGGGVALIRAQKALDKLELTGDEKIGASIIRRSIEQPLRTLVENAGGEGSVIVNEVKNRKGNDGYNVATGEYVDMIKAGVVDPTGIALPCRMRLPSAACS